MIYCIICIISPEVSFSCNFDHWSELTDWSVVSGVYPVIRKWRRGVGMRDAIKPIRSLFM